MLANLDYNNNLILRHCWTRPMAKCSNYYPCESMVVVVMSQAFRVAVAVAI